MYKKIIESFFDKVDSEKAHMFVRELLHYAETSSLTLASLEALVCHNKRYTHEKLQIEVCSIAFENPLLVGAGWGK